MYLLNVSFKSGDKVRRTGLERTRHELRRDNEYIKEIRTNDDKDSRGEGRDM